MRSSSGIGALALLVLFACGATPWGRNRVERVRSLAGSIFYLVGEVGFDRTLVVLRGGKLEKAVDLRPRTPEQVIAGASTPHDPPPLASCLGTNRELEPEAERRVEELLRRGEKSLPALTKALSSPDPERVRIALVALRRGGLPVPEAVPVLDRLLSDRRLGDDAALVLWNSGPKGRAVIEKAVFYAPPLPPLPRQGDDSPAARAVHELFDVQRRREEAAQTPIYRDPDAGFEILRRALESESHGARYDAAYQMGYLKSRRAEGVAALAAALEKEEDFLPRSAMIGALERLGPDAAAAVPVLRRLAGNRETAGAAAGALFAVTGSNEELERLVAQVENGERLHAGNLDTFAKACPRSSRARAIMERAYAAGDYRDHMEESMWRSALQSCLGDSLTPVKQAAFDALHEKAVKARLEKSKKG